MTAVEEIAPRTSVAPVCRALGVPRATVYRRRRARRSPRTAAKARPTPARALQPVERRAVLDVLHSERFVDKAPGEVMATLLDEGQYLCSVRTMYRVLAADGEVRERRNQLRHPQYAKPELLATAPNQVWSWDITKLKGPVTWTYFYLYVILDIFSRLVVGWMLALRESAELAKRLIAETCEKQGIVRDRLTLHSDRGSSMKSQTVGQLLGSLGVTKRDALSFSRAFFDWYNNDHRHSGIRMLTPAMVHYGQAESVLAGRQAALAAAYAAHPERFVRGVPRVHRPPEAVWINPPPVPATAGSGRAPAGCQGPRREEIVVPAGYQEAAQLINQLGGPVSGAPSPEGLL